MLRAKESLGGGWRVGKFPEADRGEVIKGLPTIVWQNHAV